jgi:uncharacterized integral membrane protein
MVGFLKFVVIAPFAILFLIFAFANRHMVSVSFDPFDSGAIPPIEAPLFIVLILAVALGVIAGGLATWFSQGRHRRAARANRAEADKLRTDLDSARAALPTAPSLARRA